MSNIEVNGMRRLPCSPPIRMSPGRCPNQFRAPETTSSPTTTAPPPSATTSHPAERGSVTEDPPSPGRHLTGLERSEVLDMHLPGSLRSEGDGSALRCVP